MGKDSRGDGCGKGLSHQLGPAWSRPSAALFVTGAGGGGTEVVRGGLEEVGKEAGDVAGVVDSAVVRADERQAEELQGLGHAAGADVVGGGEGLLQIAMLDEGEFEAVATAFLGELLAVERAPGGEQERLVRPGPGDEGGERLGKRGGVLDVGLLDRGEAAAEIGKDRLQDRADERLMLFDDAAARVAKHRADFDGFVRGGGIALPAGAFEIDDEVVHGELIFRGRTGRRGDIPATSIILDGDFTLDAV